MESDYRDLLHEAASTCAKMARNFEVLAELFGMASTQFQAFMDWVSDVAVDAFEIWSDNFIEQFMDISELLRTASEKTTCQQKKLRPDYKTRCKIRELNLPNKVMFGRIRRFV